MKKSFVVLFVSGFAALVLCFGAEKAKEKLPVVDCAVLWSHGNFGAYGGPGPSDTITLDLNEIEKIKDKLEFKTTRTGPAYIPLTAPFKLTRKMRDDLPQYFDMKFASTDELNGLKSKVTIEVRRLGQPDSRKYDVYVITESDDFITGIAVLEGTARNQVAH